MENTNTLKDLAINAAKSVDAKELENNNPESELANMDEGNENVTYVGDTPVVLAPPSKENTSEPNAQFVNDIMSTPTPTAIGLDLDTLETPMVNIPGVENKANDVEAGNSGLSQEDLDMLEEIMPDLSIEERIERALPLLNTRESIAKDLIIKMGFTVDEANSAANTQIRKKLTDEYNSGKTNSDVGVIEINKTDDPNNLGLTKEEHQKLEKVKKVRLVVVEDVDLANITIERPDEEHKADYITSIEGSLSKYSVPMPMLGDFISFKGAQMIQMVNIVNYEDARIDEIISTKSSLIYEKLIGGNILHKYDGTGKNIMSYNEFANKFPYQDIDMALYGILCASSMEENSTSLTCTSCSHQWLQTYNLKSLLKFDSITDAFKNRVDGILKNKSNDIEMRKLYEDMRKVKRYKSPFTNNIYDLSYPSIARAIDLLKRINQEDNVMTYLSAIALYMSRILVYNEAKNSYVEVTADETDLMLETMKTLSNEDVNMLAKQIHDELYYAPQFILSSKCPSCGKTSEIPVSIENLIFLIARDSMVEIDN